MSVSRQHFSHEVLICVVMVRKCTCLDICTAHSDRRKYDLVIVTALNVTSFSRPATVRPSDQKCGVLPMWKMEHGLYGEIIHEL